MIRVIIADDFSAIEQVMEKMIEAAEDMELVGTARRFDEALPLVKEVPHDVIILNDYLPPMQSPMAIRQIRAEGVESPIVVVSMHEDAELARRALEEGANGYVLKPNFMEEFVDAIRDAHDGKKFGSPEIVAKLKELLGDAADKLFGT
jgi:DNA-binding NarL/FixJ family response regulator